MANFAGKYMYEKSEGLEDYLRKIAGPPGADAAKDFEQNKPMLEINESGKKFQMNFYSGEKTISYSFELNKEFDEPMLGNFSLKTIVSKKDNKLIYVSKLSNGNTSTREYMFTSKGIEAFYSEQKYGMEAFVWFDRV